MMPRYRVAMAGTVSGRGGIQTHLRYLSQGLIERGMEVLLLPLNGQGPDRPAEWRAEIFVPAVGSDPASRLARLRRARELRARLAVFRPHLYIAVGTGYALYLLPMFLPGSPRLMFHEVMSGELGDWRDSRHLVRLLYDEAAGQSPVVAATFKRSAGWRKAVPALAALPEPLERNAVLPTVQRHTVEKGRVRAAMFSRLVPHKQAYWLVQQWDRLSDVLSELHIYGTGPEEALIHEFVRQRNIGDRVKCLGAYPDGQAYVDLMARYDLTLLPTIGAEGAPLVLLESMACGVPFVAYGVGGIPDYATDNPDVRVVPTEAEQFIGAVREQAERLQRGEIDHARLQTWYLQRYSYDVLVGQWAEHLENLMRGPSVRHA